MDLQLEMLLLGSQYNKELLLYNQVMHIILLMFIINKLFQIFRPQFSAAV